MKTQHLACKFCSTDGYYNCLNPSTAQFSQLEIHLSSLMKHIRVRAIRGEKLTTQDVVQIKFCPVCGREL